MLCLSFTAWAAPTPPDRKGGYQTGEVLRVISGHERYSLLGEIAATQATDDRDLKDITVGTYYHLNNNLKAGVFYRHAYGLRHDDDWARDSAGNWRWLDTNDRGEGLVQLDLTVKSLVEFMPGEDWVAELKTRWVYNAFNGEQYFLLRPGLTYFLLSEGNLVANFYMQVELDLPTNYGNRAIMEKWIYLGSLYHFSERFDLGPFVTFGWQSWSRPDDYARRGGADYTVTTQTTTLGVVGLFRF